MTQRIDYAELPNTKEAHYLTTVTKLFRQLEMQPDQSFKQLREWMKTQQIWDKEGVPKVLALLGLRVKGKNDPMETGTLGPRFLAAEGLEGQCRVLSRWFFDQNPLLWKYVLDALDPEQNGRLHSTHELHRMLSSFVYPGRPIGLPDFKAWIAWAVGAGSMKLVGIRWGLTDVGKEFARIARDFDVEEFLEDEAETPDTEEADLNPDEHEEDPPSAETSEAPADPRETPEAAPSGQGKGTAAKSAKPERALKAPSVTPRAAAAPETPLERAAKTASARRSAPVRQVLGAPIAPALVTWLAPSVPATPLFGADETSVRENRDTLCKAWSALGKPGMLHLGAFGVEADQFHEQAETFLFRAAFLSLAADLGGPGLVPGAGTSVEASVALYRQLDDMEFFEQYVDLDLPLEEALPDPVWELCLDGPSLRDRLIYLVALKRNLRREPEWFAALHALTEPRDIIDALRRGPLAGIPSVRAPYWLVRELHRVGLLSHDAHALIAVVPGLSGRAAATRLGFLDRAYANGDADLLRAGELLAPWFGRDTDYADPLETIPGMLGCSEQTRHSHRCPFHCALKLPWNLS